MRNRLLAWTPATMMAVASVFTLGVNLQRPLPLRESLVSAIPLQLAGYTATDLRLSEVQEQAAGMTDYVMRTYQDTTADGGQSFSVYVAYYAQQSLGHTIHSPKNCLPGTGWQALASRTVEIETPDGPVKVNRYIVHKESQRALVLYWYQGRGRVEASEYRVKWDLLRDSAIRRRSDEALARIVIPIAEDEGSAAELATQLAPQLFSAVTRALQP